MGRERVRAREGERERERGFSFSGTSSKRKADSRCERERDEERRERFWLSLLFVRIALACVLCLSLYECSYVCEVSVCVLSLTSWLPTKMSQFILLKYFSLVSIRSPILEVSNYIN